MMLTTADFPQADRLEQVGKVAVAIAQGHRADDKIEKFIGLDSDGRQGRYYRLAAQVLGLIANQNNSAILTPLGEEFVSLTGQAARTDLLARCLIETPVFHQALQYIQKHSPNDQKLKVWFRSIYPGATSTADRRFSTFVNYLHDSKLIKWTSSGNELTKYPGNVLKKDKPWNRSLTGKNKIDNPGISPVVSAGGVIHVDIDAQKRERANLAHWKLIDAKSSFLGERGYVPLANPNIDLFAQTDGDVIIYEMKSVDAASVNLLSQVRKAVAQLYEYRYIYQEPKAQLCLVTDRDIAEKDRWLLEYLAKDRGIAYEWTDDYQNFQCEKESKSLLGKFTP